MNEIKNKIADNSKYTLLAVFDFYSQVTEGAIYHFKFDYQIDTTDNQVLVRFKFFDLF